VAVDAEGPMVSSVLQVTNVTVNMRSFAIQCDESFNVAATGAMVLAMSDASVLGLIVRSTASVAEGHVWHCLPMAKHLRASAVPALSVVQAARGALHKSFPTFSLYGWPDDEITEAFTHSSVQVYPAFPHKLFNAGNLPLAQIGDAYLKVALARSLRESGLPHSKWATVAQELHSNKNLSAKALSTGLAAAVVVGNGVTLPPDSKAYADLFEAIVGMAYLHDTNEIVDSFLLANGLLLTDYSRFK